MINPDTFKDTLFTRAQSDFEGAALDLFRYQAKSCEPYSRFIKGLGISPETITRWEDIPFLPIEAFKNHDVKSGRFNPEVIYTSSGTTGSHPSRHYVRNRSWYEQVFVESFRYCYGEPMEYQWLCLLPSYLERSGSSLIDMAAHFIDRSFYDGSGFYLNEFDPLKEKLKHAVEHHIPTVLLGVSFALMDLAEHSDLQLSPDIIVMETGGMKGRRKELVRAELHDLLTSAFGIDRIHSEYGMTELMSQAYSKGSGIYRSPPWMRILLRDPADPLSRVPVGKTGGIDVIDLANIDSCAFIATQDLGRIHGTATFEVLGRFDDSDIRGCNLMIS